MKYYYIRLPQLTAYSQPRILKKNCANLHVKEPNPRSTKNKQTIKDWPIQVQSPYPTADVLTLAGLWLGGEQL